MKNDLSNNNSLLSPKLLGSLSLFLLIFGVRCHYINFNLGSIPFWDQWFAEFYGVLIHFKLQKLTIARLFKFHNEHLVITTRLLSIFFFWINGYWDLNALIIFSALLRAFNMTLLYNIITPKHDLSTKTQVMILLFFISMLPFSVLNLFSGFQIQFYLQETFSIIALFIFCRMENVKLKPVIVGIGFIILSFLSLSGGFLPAMVLSVMFLLQQIQCQKLDLKKNFLIVLLMLLSMTCIFITPSEQFFHAKSFEMFIEAFFICLSWPFSNSAFVGVINYVPLVALLIMLLSSKKTEFHYLSWFVLSLGGWILINMLAISYARGYKIVVLGGMLDQYLDIFAFGYLVNLLSIIQLSREKHAENHFKKNKIFIIAAWIWIIWTGYNLGYEVKANALPYIEKSVQATKRVERKFRNALKTGDWSYAEQNLVKLQLEAKNHNFSFFMDPEGRYNIPAHVLAVLKLNEPIIKSMFHPDLTLNSKPSLCSNLIIFTIRNSVYIIIIGAFFLLIYLATIV